MITNTPSEKKTSKRCPVHQTGRFNSKYRHFETHFFNGRKFYQER